MNAQLYKQWVRPWVQMTAFRPIADAMGKQNPLRLQRQLLSDQMPFAPFIRQGAEWARTHRAPIADDHPLRAAEQRMSASITEQLNKFRDQRIEQSVQMARQLYGPKGLGALFKPDTPDAEIAHERALKELEAAREAVLPDIAKVGLPRVCAVSCWLAWCRWLVRTAQPAPGPPAGPIARHSMTGVNAKTDWVKLLKAQARLTAVAPVEALNAGATAARCRQPRKRPGRFSRRDDDRARWPTTLRDHRIPDGHTGCRPRPCDRAGPSTDRCTRTALCTQQTQLSTKPKRNKPHNGALRG